jgi:hypothetical protein
VIVSHRVAVGFSIGEPGSNGAGVAGRHLDVVWWMPQFCGMFAAMTNQVPTNTSFKKGDPRPGGAGR